MCEVNLAVGRPAGLKAEAKAKGKGKDKAHWPSLSSSKARIIGEGQEVRFSPKEGRLWHELEDGEVLTKSTVGNKLQGSQPIEEDDEAHGDDFHTHEDSESHEHTGEEATRVLLAEYEDGYHEEPTQQQVKPQD